MIKLLKLQKAVFVIIAGILSFVAYKIMDAHEVRGSIYFEMLSGVLLIIGALWFLYPILFAKKDEDGNAEILTDPTVEIKEDEEEKPTVE
ncbi:isoleucyl-tRNA synthetase [Pedobacter nototheniae]|uniref:isoleucyl-tRNA synthetase n=1 Tax=Pedobacter nototheniae TaxID=2488994 RepID=UPI00103D3DF5|nr:MULTISPECIES: isoleucyl-tRNA synthetase [Pedobacter]